MKQVLRLTILAFTILIPLTYSGQTSAAPESITQELKVSAEVPHHRDIIIDTKGNIVEITSNTPRDVMPDVYTGSVSEGNKRELTTSLYEQYRTHVPEGTAKYGVLYKKYVFLASLNARENWLPPVRS